MRPTDQQVGMIAEGGILCEESLVVELAKECMEARKRGTTGTVDDLASNRIPTNMDEATYVLMPEGGLSICAWTPNKNGKGKTTQVHIVFDLTHLVEGFHAVTRLKSGHGVDTIVKTLVEYRNEVWPQFRGLSIRRP